MKILIKSVGIILFFGALFLLVDEKFSRQIPSVIASGGGLCRPASPENFRPRYEIGMRNGRYELVRLWNGTQEVGGYTAQGFFPRTDDDVMSFDSMDDLISKLKEIETR